jgi:hypothetical protein
MSWAHGSQTIKVNHLQADFVRLLVREGYATNGMHVLELAVALGLRKNLRQPVEAPLTDLAKVGQFDPEGMLTEAILHKYGRLPEGERLVAVMEHASAGLERIKDRFEQTDAMDLAALLAD